MESLAYAVLFSNSAGISSFRDEGLPWQDYPIVANLPVSATTLLDAERVGFLRLPVGFVQDWHTSPGKRFVLVLTGTMDVEAGSGEVRTFRASDILLITDLDGQGHRTRVVGDTEVLFAWVPVP